MVSTAGLQGNLWRVLVDAFRDTQPYQDRVEQNISSVVSSTEPSVMRKREAERIGGS